MNFHVVIPSDKKSIKDIRVARDTIEPFSDILVLFVDEISKAILKDSIYKQYPELIALAFWMRKSHIKSIEKYFRTQNRDKIIIGRGVVFHLAPSNVDTIFVYSWFISLLVGNSNILRISDKENIQTELLLNIIKKILNKDNYKELQDRVAVIKYGHDDSITEELSMMADMRVIWGGDNTINHIRTIPIKPSATELIFADKFSFAILNATTLLQEKKIEQLIERFYNDAFWFSQMACSSIRLVAWIGDSADIEKAKRLFWEYLNRYVSSQHPKEIAPADIVNKLVAECSMAIESQTTIIQSDNPYINRVEIKSISDVREELHCGTGLFYEIECDTIENLMPYITKKHQTISQYGFDTDELKEMILTTQPMGIDRVVPIGKSLEFSYIWDGNDLLKSFSREVEIWS